MKVRGKVEIQRWVTPLTPGGGGEVRAALVEELREEADARVLDAPPPPR